MIAVNGQSGQVKIWQAANEIRSETHDVIYDIRTEGGSGWAQNQTIALQSVPLGLTQGFVKRFFKSSTGRLAIPQLMSSQASSKMLKELLKRNKENLNVRPSGARCYRLFQCYSIKEWAKIPERSLTCEPELFISLNTLLLSSLSDETRVVETGSCFSNTLPSRIEHS